MADARRAIRTVRSRAAEWHLQPDRIGIMGFSAGGELAAFAAMQSDAGKADAADAIERVSSRPDFQALIYPAVDQTRSFPSLKIMERGFLLDRATIDWFLEQYSPDPANWDKPRASPWFADVKSVAPALVQTAGFDPLRDEGEAYAVKLREAGVAVSSKRYPSMVHGYISITGSIVVAREAWGDLVAALRGAFR